MKKVLISFLVLLASIFFVVPTYSLDTNTTEHSGFYLITTTLDKLLFPAIERYVEKHCKDQTPEDMDFEQFRNDLMLVITHLCRIYHIPITKPPQLVIIKATKNNTIVKYVVWIQLYCFDLDEEDEDIPMNIVIGKGFQLFTTTVSEKLPV